MHYSIKIYSRIGELMQGVLPDRTSFLVSGLPSSTLYSEAILEDGPGDDVLPPKVSEALSFFLPPGDERLRHIADKALRLRSNIPRGKGLSSSSADVLSILYVVNDYLRTGFTPEELYRIAARVEPTDPCLSSGVVLFRQQTGVTERSIPLPPLTLLYFDAAPDREISTLELERPYPEDAPRFFEELLRRFLHTAAENDYAGLFDCITASAVYNQAIVTLPRFNEYHALALDAQAGLMVAHSGTIIGLLTRPGQAALLREKLQRMANRYRPTDVHMENYSSPIS
jgi:L-threonine kinase